MAPGIYLPLRSSSSTRLHAPRPSCSSSSHHRQPATASAAAPTSTLPAVVATPGHGQLPFPAFQSSSRSIIMPTATVLVHPKNANTEGVTDRVCYKNSSMNYSSSGSLHHGHDHDDPSSVCLAAMVHQFLEEEEKEDQEFSSPEDNSVCGRARCNCVDGVCGDEFCAIIDEGDDDEANLSVQVEILQGYTNCSNKAERVLQREVEQAIEMLIAAEHDAAGAADGRDRFGRLVMRHLRDAGHNAAACKSRWSKGDGLPAGDYEYIDVLPDALTQDPTQRLIVDIDFRAQFEIARPSREYLRLLEVVPRVFVGRAEGVKQVVRMMSQAAKRSLKARGLRVPPWRKHKYMQAKWLSPIYRRTTNMQPASMNASKLPCEEMRKRDVQRLNVQDVAKHEEALEYYALYKVRPLENAENCRDVCTAMCTSWRLPPLEEFEERAALSRVSALSTALQQYYAGEQQAVGVVS